MLRLDQAVWLQLSILGFCENSSSVDVGAFRRNFAAQSPFLGLMTNNGKVVGGGGRVGAPGGGARAAGGASGPLCPVPRGIPETAWRRSWKDRRGTWELCLVGTSRAAAVVTMVPGGGCQVLLRGAKPRTPTQGACWQSWASWPVCPWSLRFVHRSPSAL